MSRRGAAFECKLILTQNVRVGMRERSCEFQGKRAAPMHSYVVQDPNKVIYLSPGHNAWLVEFPEKRVCLWRLIVFVESAYECRRLCNCLCDVMHQVFGASKRLALWYALVSISVV